MALLGFLPFYIYRIYIGVLYLGGRFFYGSGWQAYFQLGLGSRPIAATNPLGHIFLALLLSTISILPASLFLTQDKWFFYLLLLVIYITLLLSLASYWSAGVKNPNFYSSAGGFVDDLSLSTPKNKTYFKDSYLSINVPIRLTPEIFSQVWCERKKFSEFEREALELYKDESLHFTLGAAVQLKNDPTVEKIKEIVEPKKAEVLEIVAEEVSKLRAFKVAAKFTKATPKSIFVFVSFEKEMEKSIKTFQATIVGRVYKILEGTGIERYEGNKPFGRPVNFARWNVDQLPSNAKNFFEQYTKGFTEDINAEVKVTEAVLTYSDQSWSNPKENIIEKFELK